MRVAAKGLARGGTPAHHFSVEAGHAVLQAIVEHSPIAMLVVASDGRIRLANHRLERLFGYSQRELLGASVEMLVPASARQRHRRLRAGFIAAGIPTTAGAVRELCGAHKTNGPIPVEIHLAPITISGETMCVASIIDLVERRDFEGALAATWTREQRRLGADLHDGLGQELTGISLMVQALKTRLRDQSTRRQLSQIAALLRRSLETIRALATGLSPTGLTGDGPGALVNALRRLAQESARSSGLSVRFRLRRGGPAELTEDSATQLYRIAQEATSNALRHANAKQVVIGLTLSEAKTRLVIDDDGGGIRARQEHAGLGLHLMKYRAGLMGATLTIESRARRGTRVTCVKYAQGDAAA